MNTIQDSDQKLVTQYAVTFMKDINFCYITIHNV